MKYVAIGTHPPPTAEEQADIDLARIDENRAHFRAHLADGTYDCVYVMEGSGRFVIGNAESEAELLSILQEPPDHPERVWTITRLRDYEVVIDDYLRSLGVIPTD